MRRVSVVLGLVSVSLATLIACGDDPNRPLGADCDGNSECQSGLCYLSECIDPSADDDLDTLTNGFEVGLDADPRAIDSDADGKPDVLEVPGLIAIDSDTDGRPDIIESAVSDQDGDCIVDELDPRDTSADPNGCNSEPVTSCDDLYLTNPTRPSGPQTIDPDGEGPAPAVSIDCAIGPAQGGAGRLDSVYRAVLEREGPRQRRYLLIANDNPDAWILSPPTSEVFDFTKKTHLPGTWFASDGEGGVESFVCPTTGTKLGVGIGCFADVGAYASDANVDAANGGVQACSAITLPFGGCVPATAYAREVRCPSDDGMLMDGELVALGKGERTCWAGESIDQGGGGIGGNMFIDTEGARADHAPAIRAEKYAPSEGFPWTTLFTHRDLAFARDTAYRLVFWARAATPRQVLLNVGPDDSTFVEVLFVDTEWREYSIDFVATTTTLVGRLGIYVGLDEAGTTLWLDSFSLHELGPNACDPTEDPGNLLPGGDFRYGAACFERIRSTLGHYGTLLSEADAMTNGPSLRVEQYGDDDESVPYIMRRNIPLVAGHDYALSFEAKAATARTFDIIVTADNPLALHFQGKPELTTSWARQSLTMSVDAAQGEPGNALVMLIFGAGGSDTMWIDELRFVDLGPTP